MVAFTLFALTVLAYPAEVVRPGLVGRLAMAGSRLLGPEGARCVGDGLFRWGRCPGGSVSPPGTCSPRSAVASRSWSSPSPGTSSVGASGAVRGVGAPSYVLHRRPGAASYVLHRRPGAASGRFGRPAAGPPRCLAASAWFTSRPVPVGAVPAGGGPAPAVAYAPRDRRPVAVRAGAAAPPAVLPAVAAWKVSEPTGGSVPL
ncbi:hypothetical protein [Streptomyces sp. NRRL F-5650]|uniref:hypothetical protein n=1 Tax=Streptomyces sp. NRRL F-5650 TaxID=1463868 RepID=UPI00068C614E|nr:hypothetical protein [Streptomyces sp. NRRL F-5650]